MPKDREFKASLGKVSGDSVSKTKYKTKVLEAWLK
jgi:hypothetical protein